MRAGDAFRFAVGSLTGYRMRTALTLLSMAIGVAAVVVLTALGEGARRYVTGEFASLGTHLLIVLPGRTETVGGAPPLLAETPRDLTIDDAVALARHRSIRRVAPIALGAAEVSHGSRSREVTIIGSTHDLKGIRRIELGGGKFLPAGNVHSQAPVAVVGAKIRKELFGSTSPLGRWIRIGDRRFRVIGISISEGRSLGLDLEEMVIVPVAAAQEMFNTFSLFRIMTEAGSRQSIPRARQDILATIKQRHDGEEDVTVITQDAVLRTFDRVLRALTYGVGGIAAISLAVAGVLVMNVMLVSVTERTAEIGLLKAVGSSPAQILRLFLAEAVLLSAAGGLVGLAAGHLGASILGRMYPALPIEPPLWAVVAALTTAMATGLIFGVLPARRAADLDPVSALSGR